MPEFTDFNESSEMQDLGDGNYRIQIIKNGLTKDQKRYYPMTTLKSAVDEGLYDNAKMFINHELNPNAMHRNMHDYVGTIVEGSTRLEADGSVSAIAHFHNQATKDLLNDSIARKTVGISQSATTKYYTGNINAKPTKVIDKIKKVNSVDLVPTGNAWGNFLESLEEENMDYTSLTLDELSIERPDIVEAIKEMVEPKTVEVEVVKEVDEAVIEERVSKRLEEMTLETTQKELATNLINATELPQITKDKLIGQIDYSVENLEESVKEMCAKEEEYIEALKATMPVVKEKPSQGLSQAVVEEDTKESYNDKFAKKLKSSGFNKDEIEKITNLKKGE